MQYTKTCDVAMATQVVGMIRATIGCHPSAVGVEGEGPLHPGCSQ